MHGVQRGPLQIWQTSQYTTLVSTATDVDPLMPLGMSVPRLGDTVYRLNDSGAVVYWTQRQMQALGVMKGVGCTGVMTAEFRAALAGFMGTADEETVLDQSVIDRLVVLGQQQGSGTVRVTRGGYYDWLPEVIRNYSYIPMSLPGNDVRWVQTCLVKLGYLPGEALEDDMAGSSLTMEALVSFQRRHNLQPSMRVYADCARILLDEVVMQCGYDALPELEPYLQ